MSNLILGIDVSKLDLSVSLLIDKKYYQIKVDNNQQGFLTLSKWLLKHKATKVTACMEATGTYGKALTEFLMKHNHNVSVVNPLCISAFAKSKLSHHKTDKVDSMIIAEYASKNDLPLYAPRCKHLVELQDLYRCLQNLKSQQTQIQNYLESREHLSHSVCQTYDSLLQTLNQEIKNVESKIDLIIAHHKDIKQKADNIQTIPGVGKLTAVAILAETPDLNKFPSARHLAAYVGLTPKHRFSGTSVRGRSSISKMGSGNLRKALYLPAIVAKKHNPMFINFAQKLASKGKPPKVIIIAIMRKLLHLVFGVVKNNSTFDPNFLLDS